MRRLGWMSGAVVITASALGLSCKASDSAADAGKATTGTETSTTGGDTAASGGFKGGKFLLTTYEVKDECLDGGLELLFMPDGKDKPYAVSDTPTELPDQSTLPKTLTVNLKAPFKALDIKLESKAANQMSVKDAKQTGIQVDKTNYGDCVVDMNVNADITAASADALDLAVTIDVSKWTSAADKKCPTPKAEPCKVTLSMKGARQ